MSDLQSKMALLFQSLRSVDPYGKLAPIVLSFREVLHVLEIAKGPDK